MMDHWAIALDIEMIQWDELMDSIDNLIWWIEVAPDQGEIDYEGIPSGQIAM